MAKDFTAGVVGSCKCQTCTVETTQPPKARLICHCSNCKAFTGGDFGDVVIYPTYKARLRNKQNLSFRYFRTHRWPPPNLNRGRCKTCDTPVVEIFGESTPLETFFIPAAIFARKELLPPPSAHLFYEHRVSEHDDSTPKYQGYAASEMTILRLIARSL